MTKRLNQLQFSFLQALEKMKEEEEVKLNSLTYSFNLLSFMIFKLQVCFNEEFFIVVRLRAQKQHLSIFIKHISINN